MRVARWRWVLVPMAVVVAGCLPQPPAPDLPRPFLEAFGAATFTVRVPPAGETGQDVVAFLRRLAGEGPSGWSSTPTVPTPLEPTSDGLSLTAASLASAPVSP